MIREEFCLNDRLDTIISPHSAQHSVQIGTAEFTAFSPDVAFSLSFFSYSLFEIWYWKWKRNVWFAEEVEGTPLLLYDIDPISGKNQKQQKKPNGIY